MGTARYTFNKTVEYLQQPETKASWMEIKKWLLKELPEWAEKVPFQVKGIGVKDACDAVKQCKVKFRSTGKINKVSFRSRKAPKQSIFIPQTAVTEKGVYHTLLGSLRLSEKNLSADHDIRLTCDNGRWFLNVPVDCTIAQADNQGRVVAIDPGIRTFASFYAQDSCGKIGCGDFSRIMRLCLFLDSLISRISKAKAQQKQRMKKAANRLRWKIKDFINELHHKAALFFVKNFDIILLPTFETSEMAVKNCRKIRAKSVRAMLTFAHFRFKMFIKNKAWEYGKCVIDVNEAYTTKTCSWNGKIKQVGGAKFIRDEKTVVDRDYNGARGIFLRALGDNPFCAKA